MSNDYPFFFTWSAQHSAKPVEFVGGEGVHFFTADGGKWLDLGSLSYQVHVGHGNRRIADAMKKQIDAFSVAPPSAVFPAKIELAEKLLAMAPKGFSKVFFTLGGAEANENAIKIARVVTGRYKLMSRYRSYHGATMGALTLTGDWRRPAVEPGLPGVIHLHDVFCATCGTEHPASKCRTFNASSIAEVMRLEGANSIAAVILEPVPGANGVIIPPADYWPTVRKACDDNGTLLIADEVLNGFGRTGKPFGFQHWDVVPDMITIAKGMASGYAPMGAVLVHERVAKHFDERILACGLTYYAHPVGCAAAVETIKVYEDEKMYDNAARLGPVLLAALEKVKARVGVPTQVRGIGLLAVLEFDAPPAAWATLNRELAARKLSLHVEGSRGTAVFAPPLCITGEELVAGVQSFGDAAVIAFGAAQ